MGGSHHGPYCTTPSNGLSRPDFTLGAGRECAASRRRNVGAVPGRQWIFWLFFHIRVIAQVIGIQLVSELEGRRLWRLLEVECGMFTGILKTKTCFELHLRCSILVTRYIGTVGLEPLAGDGVEAEPLLGRSGTTGRRTGPCAIRVRFAFVWRGGLFASRRIAHAEQRPDNALGSGEYRIRFPVCSTGIGRSFGTRSATPFGIRSRSVRTH